MRQRRCNHCMAWSESDLWDGYCPECGGAQGDPPTRDGPMIMPDINPYKSMVTGEMITSRSAHREHLRRHNKQEIGNEKLVATPVREERRFTESRLKRVAELVNHYGEDRIRQSARELGERLRWNSRGK